VFVLLKDGPNQFCFAERLSSPKIENISLYRNSDLRYQSRVPAHRGTFRDRHDTLGKGCDGRGNLRRNGLIPKGIKARRRTKDCRGRRSRVVLAPRPWRYVCGSFPPATGARKAASPGRARISR